MSKQTIKVVLSPFPQPINIVIEQTVHQASIQLSETAPTPFSIPDKSYVHTQDTPNTIWSIQHNLNKFPNIALVDDTGATVWGNLKFINMDLVEAHFSEEISGQAFAN